MKEKLPNDPIFLFSAFMHFLLNKLGRDTSQGSSGFTFSNTVHYWSFFYAPPLKRFVLYKAPPSDKHSLLWLANWPSALWLAEHHKHVSEM